MKETLRQRALQLGFDDCRFTTAAAPQSAPRFELWLAEGRHGEMHYLARNASKRFDPSRVLPGARSVVTLAVSYTSHSETRAGRGNPCAAPSSDSQPPTLNPQLSGKLARYAQYTDYHDLLRPALVELTGHLSRLGGPGARSLWYVDTGPILERDFAQRSGLGFIGKHTNLISRSLGNWFFIAEILTTLELEPDPPEHNRCGSCTRCIAACPTGAITAPFQLDARRCISYLTIELKGPIPTQLRPAIGTRIFGCDDCLAVCPWNRFAHEGRLMQPHFRPDMAALDLVELLGLDEPEFKRRFAGTPLFRAKRRGLLRNVCVALGNLKDPRALPALARAAHDPEPLIAEHAEWAKGEIERPKTVSP